MEPQIITPHKYETQLIQSDAFKEALFTQPNYEIDTLQGNKTVVELGADLTEGSINETIEVEQNVVAVVTAGSESFSIVRAYREGKDKEPVVLLARMRSFDGSVRPEIIAAITDKPLTVGRKTLEDGSLTMSNKHFFVQRDEAGDIVVTDNNSTNNTKVVKYETQPVAAESTGFTGLKKLIGRRKAEAGLEPVQPQQNPLDNFGVWAPSSERAESYLGLSGQENEPNYNDKLMAIDTISTSLHEARFDEWNAKNDNKGAINNLRSRAVELIKTGDIDTISDIQEIVVSNTLGGIELPPLLGKWSGGAKYEKVSRFLDIYQDSPDLAKIIVEKEVAGFHGSRSASLWGVLKHKALLSAAEAKVRLQPVVSGERTYSVEGGQQSISFADWRRPDSIASYSGKNSQPLTIEDLEERRAARNDAYESSVKQWGEKHPFAHNSKVVADDLARQIELFKEDPSSEEARLTLDNFPIAFGVSTLDMESKATVVDDYEAAEDKPKVIERVPSDIKGEFMIDGKALPLSYIPIVAVPNDQINRVQQLFNEHNHKIAVIDIDLIAGEDLVPQSRQPEDWDYLYRKYENPVSVQ